MNIKTRSSVSDYKLCYAATLSCVLKTQGGLVRQIFLSFHCICMTPALKYIVYILVWKLLYRYQCIALSIITKFVTPFPDQIHAW